MLLVTAILVALFYLPLEWDAVLILIAAVVEVSEAGFWFWWTHRARPVVGAEAMIGARGEVVEALRPEGWVRVQGELWRARSSREVDAGESVRVRAIDGLTLDVAPKEDGTR